MRPERDRALQGLLRLFCGAVTATVQYSERKSLRQQTPPPADRRCVLQLSRSLYWTIRRRLRLLRNQQGVGSIPTVGFQFSPPASRHCGRTAAGGPFSPESVQ